MQSLYPHGGIKTFSVVLIVYIYIAKREFRGQL